MFFSEIYQPGVADFDPSGKLARVNRCSYCW